MLSTLLSYILEQNRPETSRYTIRRNGCRIAVRPGGDRLPLRGEKVADERCAMLMWKEVYRKGHH